MSASPSCHGAGLGEGWSELEMGMSWMWICMERLRNVRVEVAPARKQRPPERYQRLRESDRSELMAIFALTEYARDLAGS